MKKMFALLVCALLVSAIGCTKPLGQVDVEDRSDTEVVTPKDKNGELGVDAH